MFQVGRAVGAGPRAVAAFGYTRQVGAPCEVAMPPLPSLFSAALSTRSLPPLLSLCLLVLFPIFFFSFRKQYCPAACRYNGSKTQWPLHRLSCGCLSFCCNMTSNNARDYNLLFSLPDVDFSKNEKKET